MSALAYLLTLGLPRDFAEALIDATDGYISPTELIDSGCLVGNLLGTPSLADDDYLVVTTDMKATAYTLAHSAAPAGNPPRNVTVTHTANDTADTLGSLVIVGTNVNDEVITESVTILSGTVASSLKAFKTITSLTTPSWVIDGVEGTEDSIKIGYGNKLGLSYTVADDENVFMTLSNGVAVAATGVTTDILDVSLNTVDLSGQTYNGSKKMRAAIIL